MATVHADALPVQEQAQYVSPTHYVDVFVQVISVCHPLLKYLQGQMCFITYFFFFLQ